MKYILGSGLVAFIAKTIMPEYEIIPVGKSRYYQFKVATCDDYVVCHKDIDDFMKEISVDVGMQPIPVFFKRALSYSGQLIFGRNEGFLNNWLNKIYGPNRNPNANTLTQLDMFVYNISATDMFRFLESNCKKHFRPFVESGDKFKSIDVNNKIIHTQNKQLNYEHIISTIPLDSLLDCCGMKNDRNLEHRDLHTFVIETEDLDFEGASELLVVDDNIDFFKCTKIGKRIYQFYCNNEIPNLTSYLELFVSKYDVLSATVVRKAVPLGNSDQHRITNDFDITCVGSNAQWDDMMDISSCIRRLMKMANKQNVK